MGGAGTGARGLRDPALTSRSASRQVRIAWLLVGAGFATLLGLLGAGAVGVRWYLSNATVPRSATLQVVSGQSLLIRSSGDADWRLVTQETTVRDGDTISTGPGTVGWLTFFDGGTIELSEESMVSVVRMRTSRFWGDRKEFVLEPVRGTIYVGMAPRGDFAESRIRVVAGPAEVEMTDGAREAGAGSFLVEVQRETRNGDESDQVLGVRVAVLRGLAAVRTTAATLELRANEQTIVATDGLPGPVTLAVREMIRNGNFARGTADWVEYQDQGSDGGSVFGIIERVPVEIDGRRQVAIEFSRGSDNLDHCETGVQQQIGYTLRVYSSLRLSADVWIDEQQPPGGGEDHREYPLILKLSYVDLQGQSRDWKHAFYIQPEVGQVEDPGRATLIPRGTWQHVEFDLRSITPLPRQLSSILVYSSGHSFKTRVTNLSLTSSEAGDGR